MTAARRATFAAAALALCCTVWELPPTTVQVRAAVGRLTAVRVVPSRGGADPAGYVTGFDGDASRVGLSVRVPREGVYTLSIRYRAQGGSKLALVDVNGLTLSVMLPRTTAAFATYSAGRVELHAGENLLTIGRGWGHYDLDSIEVTTAPPLPAMPALAAVPCDPAATPQAVALWRALAADYGTGTRSGVYADADDAHVRRSTGHRPAIVGGDLMDYSPSRRARGADPGRTVDHLLAHAAGGQTVTVSWHWNAPADLLDRTVTDAHGKQADARWYKGFNANATTFDFAAALDDPSSPEYALLLHDIDAVAEPLRRFADAGVPVLWRPLHEAENGWFWWGSKGPEPFKKLWALTYDRMTRHHGLHNLLWVYTSDGDPAWYPGDATVDVVGLDGYPADLRDPLAARWDELSTGFARGKLLAVTEFGGVPDVARMHRLGCRWAYFVAWSGHEGLLRSPDADLQRVFDDPLTLNALPGGLPGAGTTRPSVTMVDR